MLDWFTTIPGILILCGVVLLIIAIVLFAVGAKKTKKEEKTSNIGLSEETNNAIPDITAMDTSVNTGVANDIPSVVPSVEEVPTVPVEGVASVSTDEVVPPVDANTTLNQDQQAYGGEIPAASFEMPEVKPVTIYGGNDPLEATQSMPKMEEHHEPYGGALNEAKIVEPSVESVVPTPVEEVISVPEVNPSIDTVVPEVKEESVVAPTIDEVTPVAQPVIEEVPTVAPVESAVEEVAPEVTPVSESTPVEPQENQVEEL